MPLFWPESGRFGLAAASGTRIGRFGVGMEVGMEAGTTALIDARMRAASVAARGWGGGVAGGAMAAGLSATTAAGFAKCGESGGAITLIR